MLNALGAHDMPVIQALALTYAITVQIASTLSEMLLRALDPRIRAAS
jgi:ABC-type dipeptide/oligopeptide/nickel transport system permease component